MWKKKFLLPVLFVMCFSLCSAQLVYAFDFALESSNTNLGNIKLPEPSDEFLDGIAIIAGSGDPNTYWYDKRPPADAIALFKKGAENKDCPYCLAALGYNMAAWDGKIDQGIELLIQSDTENCVYGSMLLSMIFWYARTLDIYSITAAEATQYIMMCLDRTIALQKYIDMNKNSWMKDEVIVHISMFGYNFAGEAGFTNFIPPNASVAIKYLNATREILKDIYSKTKNQDYKAFIETLDVYIKDMPDYVFNSVGPLCRKYADNVVGADKIFKNKTVRMTGSVLAIEKVGLFNTIAISFMPTTDIIVSEEPIFVIGTFKKSEGDKIANLHEGSNITFQGKVSGLEDEYVLITDCWVVNGDDLDAEY